MIHTIRNIARKITPCSIIFSTTIILLFSAQSFAQDSKEKCATADCKQARIELERLEHELYLQQDQMKRLKTNSDHRNLRIEQMMSETKSVKQKNALKEIYAKNRLADIRASLMIYYGDTEGEFPEDLNDLVPKYLNSIPRIQLPRYKKTRRIRNIKKCEIKDENDEIQECTKENMGGLIKNTGGWLYISDETSELYGEIYIDSKRKSKGKPFYKY